MSTDSTVVGVVGLGYVGLPLCLSMVEAGYTVVGVDINQERVEKLMRGESYVTEIEDDRVADAVDRGFRPTTEYSELSSATGISVCVPTPLRKTGTPDMSYVSAAVDDIATVVSPDTTVIIESTVYPGATQEIVQPAFEKEGFQVGEDLFLAFSPERIDPGNEEYPPEKIPKVLGGVTNSCGDHAEALYSSVFETVVRVDSAIEAELVKLLENTFRAVNIGLINEIAQIADELDVDIWSAIDAASTKPFGFMSFYPGPGLGGHCIPVDPTFLSWKAKQQDIETRFIDLADRVNREMPRHVVRRVTELLNDTGIALSNARILVLGVAYKPGVSDTRESPAHDVMQLLDERQVELRYHDPHVPEFQTGGLTYESVPLTESELRQCDCAIVLTDHAETDINTVVETAPLVFDARNATSGIDVDNIIRL